MLRILLVFAGQLSEPMRIFIVFPWPVAANATDFDVFLPRESLQILLVFGSPAERTGAISSISQVCG
jgi:hypothetical protein